MTIAAIAGVTGVTNAALAGARTEANTGSSGDSGTGGSSGTDGSSGTSGSNTSNSSTSSAVSRATSLDRDTFLKLLVAQLKYQDPSKPVDASEMISQSAELSVVEKLDAISQALAETQATNRLTLGGSMIGKQITFVGADETLVTETVTSVSFDGTAMVLRAGGWDVPIAAVRSLAAAPATTGTSTTGTTTDTGGATDTADTSTTAS